MDKKTRLAIIAFPLVFLPGLLTALFHGLIIRPSIWWGFHLTYAVACLAATGVLWLVLESANLRFKDIGLRDFRWSHMGWAFAFFIVGVSIWGMVSALLARVDLTTDWGSEIQLSRPLEVVIICQRASSWANRPRRLGPGARESSFFVQEPSRRKDLET